MNITTFEGLIIWDTHNSTFTDLDINTINWECIDTKASSDLKFTKLDITQFNDSGKMSDSINIYGCDRLEFNSVDISTTGGISIDYCKDVDLLFMNITVADEIYISESEWLNFSFMKISTDEGLVFTEVDHLVLSEIDVRATGRKGIIAEFSTDIEFLKVDLTHISETDYLRGFYLAWCERSNFNNMNVETGGDFQIRDCRGLDFSNVNISTPGNFLLTQSEYVDFSYMNKASIGGLKIIGSVNSVFDNLEVYSNNGDSIFINKSSDTKFTNLDLTMVDHDELSTINITDCEKVDLRYINVTTTGDCLTSITFENSQMCKISDADISFEIPQGTSDSYLITLEGNLNDVSLENIKADHNTEYFLKMGLLSNARIVNCDFNEMDVNISQYSTLEVYYEKAVKVVEEDGTTPVEGADIEVIVEGSDAYKTPYFGGSDELTDADGVADHKIEFLSRKYLGPWDGHYRTPAVDWGENWATASYKGDVEVETDRELVNANNTDTLVMVLDDFDIPEKPGSNTHAITIDHETIDLRIFPSSSLDVVHYEIWWKTDGKFAFDKEVVDPGGDFFDVRYEDLLPGTRYYFMILAVDDSLYKSIGVFTDNKTISVINGQVSYKEGPLSGEKASNATVEIWEMVNGTLTRIHMVEADINGSYEIPRIYLHTYTILVIPLDAVEDGGTESGYVSTSYSGVNFTRNLLQDLEVEYYEYIPPTHGNIMGVVTYSGGPNNGSLVQGVKVELITSENLVITSTLTNESGVYLFVHIEFGADYKLKVSPSGAVKKGGSVNGYLVTITSPFEHIEPQTRNLDINYYDHLAPVDEPDHPSITILDEEAMGISGVKVTMVYNNMTYNATTNETGVAIFEYEDLVGMTYADLQGANFTAWKEGYETIRWGQGDDIPKMGMDKKGSSSSSAFTIVLITGALISLILLVAIIVFLIKRNKITTEELGGDEEIEPDEGEELDVDEIGALPPEMEIEEVSVRKEQDVFISYSSKNTEVAEKICTLLEDQSIECWMAPRNIKPGKDYGQAIVDGIRSSRLMVLVFSTHANKSPQVVREVERAVSNKIPIIPVRIENVPPLGSMEYFISSSHWLEAHKEAIESYFDDVTEAVNDVLEKTDDELE
jgi:hypothetical protein